MITAPVSADLFSRWTDWVR